MRLLAAIALCMAIGLSAAPAFCAELYEDSTTGQLFSKPGEGRVAVRMPDEKMGGLYSDDSGIIYTKPGDGRTPIASSAATAAPETETAEAYNSQSFIEAVKHVVSDEDDAKYPKVKVGTLFYGEYLYDFNDKNANTDKTLGGKNKFQLNRGYINVKADITPNIRARVTPDITRSSYGGGDINFRLKFGYVDFHDFLNAYPTLEAKLGQFEGPWLDYEENLWSYRMQGTMMVEREGYFDSGNLGAALMGKLSSGYGEWQAAVDNGEGYHADENNKYKSVWGRLTLVPMPNNEYLKGLQLTGFYTGGVYEKNANVAVTINGNAAATPFKVNEGQKQRIIGFASYKLEDDLFLGFEYDRTHGVDTSKVPTLAKGEGINLEGEGYCAMAWYRMPFCKPLRVMGRMDKFNHDLNQPGYKVSRYIGGLSYDIGKSVTLLANEERTIPQGQLRKSGGVLNENLLKLDVQWKFN